MPTLPPELNEWLNNHSAMALLIWVVFIWLLIFLVVRTAMKFWPWLKRAVGFLDALFSLPAFMLHIEKQMQQIKHEVLPNKGGSMRDDLETVTLMLEKIDARVTAVEEHDANDHARLKDLEDTISRRREQRAIIQREADNAGIDLPPNPEE